MARTSRPVVFLGVLALVALIAGAYVGAQRTRPIVAHAPGYVQHTPRIAPTKPYEFPAGGRTLAAKYRFVAMYGSPDTPALGVLGEQPADASADRVFDLAGLYRPLSSEPIYPTFEIITTVASAGPTENGDYSQEVDVNAIRPWIDVARSRGVYVVLDLQPGRTDFLTQAKQYESLLKEPNVGLALDPEWRLTPTQVPLAQIGAVGIDEVNGVADWLSNLTEQNHLPQKLFVLHQFRLDMLPARELLHTSHPELAYIIQMDGQGGQPQKQDTWHAITAAPPANVLFGWKNFFTKDTPILDPAGTMAITPVPWYISYQ